jgi:hypothetical protein
LLGQGKLQEPGACSNSLKARLGFTNIFQSNDGIASAMV